MSRLETTVETLIPSFTRATSGSGNSGVLPDSFFHVERMDVTVTVTAISGAGASLAVVLERSIDGGATWLPVDTFPAITAVGAVTRSAPVAQANGLRRVSYTLTGTTPSATFSVSSYTDRRLAANEIPHDDAGVPPEGRVSSADYPPGAVPIDPQEER